MVTHSTPSLSHLEHTQSRRTPCSHQDSVTDFDPSCSFFLARACGRRSLYRPRDDNRELKLALSKALQDLRKSKKTYTSWSRQTNNIKSIESSQNGGCWYFGYYGPYVSLTVCAWRVQKEGSWNVGINKFGGSSSTHNTHDAQNPTRNSLFFLVSV